MAPHLDVPSPAGSFTSNFDRIPFRVAALSEAGTSCLAPTESLSSPGSFFESDSVAEDIHITRPLVPGVYVPTMCFFDETEEVDTNAIARHAVRLAEAGVTGLATQGSNGEAVHLTHDERQLVTYTTRKALNESGFSHVPIIVGCGAQSTCEAIEYCREAWKAGGDYTYRLRIVYYLFWKDLSF
ncbi:hypothetical protein ABKA04_005366 [Annulohypoxylon sp. FPYF3050]